MSKLHSIKPERVFAYFEEICAIPRGSKNMEQIAQYCVDFADKHALKSIRDDADNVVIFKPASSGYENSESIILQGHLDMVCQKEDSCNIDFFNDGLDIYIDGDFVKAKGTTLGADNGIAVAMMLAILESNDIAHPAIEAVFTTDEEIGMCGAISLDTSVLKSKKMINLDAEEEDILTVSCAGGSDFKMNIPIKRSVKHGTKISVDLKGLKGGHSGVEINAGRINADILAARLLNHMNNSFYFELIEINGGDKGNAIPTSCNISVCVDETDNLISEVKSYLEIIKTEICEREPNFSYAVNTVGEDDYNVIDSNTKEKLIFALLCVPNGVCQMSAEIDGLVESSQNLGVLQTNEDNIIMHFTLRSNKITALQFLEDRMKAYSKCIPCNIETFGHYPPWEYKSDSKLQELYKTCFAEQFGFDAKVEAIHAGLECGIFSSRICDIDCIAIGPALFDVHTVNERLSISSTEKIYKLLINILEKSR